MKLNNEDDARVIWNYSDSSKYTFDSSQVEVTDGKAKIKKVDQTHNSEEDFSVGTHVGTIWDSSRSVVTLLEKPAVLFTHVNTTLPSRSTELVAYWRMDGDFSDSGPNNFGVGTAFGDACEIDKITLNRGEPTK